MRLQRTIVGLMVGGAAVPSILLLSTAQSSWTVGTLFAGLGVSLALGALYTRRLIRPLRGCVREALNISRGNFGKEVKVEGHNEVGDLTHTFNYMSKQLRSYDDENRALYRTLEQGYLETLAALANSLDSKDSYTRGHSQRVSELAVAIGRELCLTDLQLKQLAMGGLLHDIGKIGIQEKILLKQSRLSDEEMAIMRQHPEIGGTIIEPVIFLAPVLAAVRNHHERWDGKGYPDGLRGEGIPLIARIINVADTWDACTSTRPYQSAVPYEKAISILRGLSGSQADPEVVVALEQALEGWRRKGRPVVASEPSPVLQMAQG